MKRKEGRQPVIQMRLSEEDRKLLAKLRTKNRPLKDSHILRLGLHALGEKQGLLPTVS